MNTCMVGPMSQTTRYLIPGLQRGREDENRIFQIFMSNGPKMAHSGLVRWLTAGYFFQLNSLYLITIKSNHLHGVNCLYKVALLI